MTHQRYTDKDPIAVQVKKIKILKKGLNSILECGAYSEKNYELQMNKKSSNYNEDEVFYAELIKEKRKHEAIKLRKEILKEVENDKEFSEYLKHENPILLKKLNDFCIERKFIRHAK